MLAEARAAWRRKGGTQRSNAARARKSLLGDARDLAGVQATLLAAMAKVDAGAMDPGPANALANLARAIATIAERVDFEQRLAALERRAASVRDVS